MKSIGKGIGRVFATLGVTLLFLVALLCAIIIMITHGPSQEAKNKFVTTLLETGRLKFVANLFLSQEEINDIVNSNQMIPLEADTDGNLINVDKDLDPNEIKIERIEGDGFAATMMIVNDPSRVFVGTTYPWSTQGKPLDELVKSYNAVGGMNAGMYHQDAIKGGGNPLGPVVSNGEIQKMGDLQYAGLCLIAMSEDNILKIIDISGKNEDEVTKIIKDEKIRDAVVFQEEASDANNHFVKLIINGERREVKGLGSGSNPRTAIGQTADGRILMLVTDGRGANGHLGANAADLVDIMESYGAVNAANLDGGSSTCMFYEGEWLQNSVTFYASNSSWYMPTSFLVK